MINFIRSLYHTFYLPPGILILVFIWLCFRLRGKSGRPSITLIVTTIILYLSSSSLISNLLIHSLEYRYQPPRQVRGDVIIMLGGGATLDTPNLHGQGHLTGPAANRLLTCMQLYRELKTPLILSGGQVTKTTGVEAEIARRLLLETGIPAERILIENKSRNTTENARYTKKLLQKYHYRRPILVTSAFHMPRAVKQFQKSGVKVLPCPTDYRTRPSYRFEWASLIPSAGAMEETSVALKEYLGLLVARWY
ncbi:MAG TPA: YdcF family protein [Bacillota bacterium]|nr:YdcF family protein [Bacillota bacterium]